MVKVQESTYHVIQILLIWHDVTWATVCGGVAFRSLREANVIKVMLAFINKWICDLKEENKLKSTVPLIVFLPALNIKEDK